MSWLQWGLVTTALSAGPYPAPAAPRSAPPGPDGVVACCDDFVRVTGQVFTARTGATIRVGAVTDDLAGDTFGPKLLDIGGVDPARYLHQHCG